MATESPRASATDLPVARKPGAIFAFVSCALCLAVVWATLSDRDAAHWASAILFALFCALGIGRFGMRERVLMFFALLVTGTAFLKLGNDAVEPVVEDMSRAAYLGTFMMLITTMREGAYSSRSVLEIGRYVTNQPPGRRYFALHIGGHFIGTLLNFGAVSLLGPLVLRGVRAAEAEGSPPELSEIRLRRQISALSRGFSWFNIWAPTAIAQAVVLTTVPGSRAGTIALIGITIAFILLWVGWAEDRVTGHRARMGLAEKGFRVEPSAVPPFPFRALTRFLTVAVGLLTLAWIVYRLSAIPFVSAIMISALPLTVLWMIAQSASAGAMDAGRLLRKVWQLPRIAIPSGSPEAATLGLAGYIGILGATLVDRSWFAGLLNGAHLTPAAVYITVSGLIPLASCIGLPPMMLVTFLGGLLVSIPQLGLDPTMLGLSLLAGWALNLTGSPFGATSLLLSRVVGISGMTHAWRWNGIFTVLSWVVAAIVILTASRLGA
ncbi:hypothetical protein [Nitratireductor sp. XY-223]|uniref:hypothetical protein n=1 Tax=Nitratireductor sp. XY-223 TaxID=2561926 RepID=UPI0010AA5E19|nr:hypothetical protein [Nitratireductor sp. XY-223]